MRYFLTTAISLTDTVIELNKNGEKEIEFFKANEFETETKKLKSYIHLAISTMKFYSEKEGLTLEEKKAEAFKAVEKLRYSKSGYFWINDYNHVVLMHGAKPALAGKNMYNLQDKKGKYLYREIVKTASSSTRSGTVEYYWTKPGKEGSHLKLSYVEEFKPWNVIVGTGIYIDEIEEHVAKMKKHIKESINETILTNLVITLIATVIIIFLVNIIINRIIAKPLRDVEMGLAKFFLFLNKETKSVDSLEVNSNDEFGKMSAVINENITKTINLIKEDELLINDVKRVVNEVNKGYIVERVNVSTSNEILEELKVILNTMLDSISSNVSTNINNVTKVLDSFAALDFRKNSKDKGRVAQELNNLSEVISKMLVMNLETSQTLQSNSTTLNDNVQKLSVASNQAAANLEETAAALEEITGNMVSNQENVQKMSNYAEDVTQSVKKGQELANKTVTSMDDINEQVEAIDNAIIIIDQIAFQTNILSLNAAVEAATAGEAGKGFAVVAQEVRNLAARAAEAAKEIKELVENATTKANEGKTIATDMINGYEHLNDSIHSTIELIDSVANSSREQQIGVTQVNDALNQLDKATQQNAAIAAEATEIAKNTNDIAQQIVDDTNEKEFIGKR